jgi:hypothetical protein
LDFTGITFLIVFPVDYKCCKLINENKQVRVEELALRDVLTPLHEDEFPSATSK